MKEKHKKLLRKILPLVIGVIGGVMLRDEIMEQFNMLKEKFFPAAPEA